ncbi:hypothetical protein B0H66DRAFT_560723 [Apodospora peruviana]|uniref:Uncharacterized protein n=1 Tax=Apodospora peruviana TaxID=516989 RepID=A0AAE0I247_9PEZI|nr:hypothetical protein B0H66DRAFT_560723 [Apodospora peruviana]
MHDMVQPRVARSIHPSRRGTGSNDFELGSFSLCVPCLPCLCLIACTPFTTLPGSSGQLIRGCPCACSLHVYLLWIFRNKTTSKVR